jgi:quercetin dioxygenase-like cupin family protein
MGAGNETITPGAAAAPGGGQWAEREKLPRVEPRPGIEARVVSGEQMTSCWIRIEPETELPAHAHPHEQIGVVVEGAVEVTIGGEARRVGPGMAYVVPGGVEHSGRTGPEGVLVVESFAPVREEYLAAARRGR